MNNTVLAKYIYNNVSFTECNIPVNTDLEITKIMQVLEDETGKRPTVLFNNVNNSAFPIIMNPFKREQIYKNLCGERKDYQEIINNRLNNYTPEIEIIDKEPEVKLHGLDDIPVLKHHINDGGKYITAAVTAVRSKKTGLINLGVYRIQVIDNKKAIIFMNHNTDGYKVYEEYINDNEDMPISVFIGADMAYYICGASKIPFTEDSYEFTSKLKGEKLSLFNLTIPVPTEARFVITGKLSKKQEPEGPFGEFLGCYCGVVDAPVFEIENVYSCHDPFYTSIVAGKESGLSFSTVQGEILLYNHLKNKDFNIKKVGIHVEEYGEFVAMIETKEPCKEIIQEAFKFDPRLKFVVCGNCIEHPWKTLCCNSFTTIKEDYVYQGSKMGEKIGFIVEESADPGKKIEVF